MRRCLVTGATGYIGGRLVPELLDAGHHVRVMVRDRRRIRDQEWAARVEVAEADATDGSAVSAALNEVDVAYYLLHSIGTGADFGGKEAQMATTFAREAEAARVSRVVYLGGMTPRGEALSEHLSSRDRVGEILLAGRVPATVLKAAIVIGSGSASFEMLRHLTERLPAMVVPRWVYSRVQPIAIRDVLRYLVGCAEMPDGVNRSFDIGGPDVLTYRDMMVRYAAIKGLPRRRIVKVPVLTPALSSLWVGLVTPVPGNIARPLVESLRNTLVCQEHDIAEYVPDPPEGLIGFERAVQLALTRIKQLRVPTRWSSASFAGAPSEPLPTDPDWAGGDLYVDERRRTVHASPEALWTVIEGIGGENGWYSFGLAWQVRGVLDSLSGGPGLRRGRRHPKRLLVGDALDWWRVEEIAEGQLVRLRAEMRLPGLAWLELIVGAADEGKDATTTFHQRALFHPKGFLGRAYWYAVWPFHGLVFGGMQSNIARAAEALQHDSERLT